MNCPQCKRLNAARTVRGSSHYEMHCALCGYRAPAAAVPEAFQRLRSTLLQRVSWHRWALKVSAEKEGARAKLAQDWRDYCALREQAALLNRTAAA